jgi:hypothetical protein
MNRKHTPKPEARRDPADPFVFTKKTVWMQRIADNVRAGSDRYISGKTDLKKIPHLVTKFSERYVLNAPRSTMALRRKQGQTTARWLGWYNAADGLVHWQLLARLAEPDGERWRDPTVDRIRVPGGYELIRKTRIGASAPAWTWKYSREQYQHLRDQMIELVRLRHDAILKQWIFSTHRTPGFAGSREQVKQLWKLLRSEWKRSRGKDEVMPEIPKNIGYVRRLPDVGQLWSQIETGKKEQPDVESEDADTVSKARQKPKSQKSAQKSAQDKASVAAQEQE